MKSKWDKGLKSARLVLKFTQPAEMVDSMPRVFDMAVEHGGIGAQPELVGFAMNPNPGVAVGLVLANLVTHIRVKNLGAASRQTSQPSLFEFRQNIAGGTACHSGKPIPFHGRVRL